MKTLEEHIRQQDRRSLPPAWKEELLANAMGTTSSVPSPGEPLFSLRLRCVLGIAWCLIIAFNGLSAIQRGFSETVSAPSIASTAPIKRSDTLTAWPLTPAALRLSLDAHSNADLDFSSH